MILTVVAISVAPVVRAFLVIETKIPIVGSVVLPARVASPIIVVVTVNLLFFQGRNW